MKLCCPLDKELRAVDAARSLAEIAGKVDAAR